MCRDDLVGRTNGEDDLRLVVEAAAQRGRADAGGVQELRRAQGVGRHDDRGSADLGLRAGAQVAYDDPGHRAPVQDDAQAQAAVGDLDALVVCGRTEDDIGFAPGVRPV